MQKKPIKNKNIFLFGNIPIYYPRLLHQKKTFEKGIMIFFFYAIECKKGTSKMQPLWISKDPCITEEKGKLIKCEGGGVGVCALGF